MTKRFLGILVLGLLWCNVGFAETISIICKDVELTELKESMEFKKNFTEWTLKYSNDDESQTYIGGKKDEDGGVSKFEVSEELIVWTYEKPPIKMIRSIDRLNGLMNTEFIMYVEGKIEKMNSSSYCKKKTQKF